MPILLGIDTGGTYTDAVLFDDASGQILASAKSLTTHHDLAEGVSNAINAVVAETDQDPARIALVGLSTTLATNALTEGRGGTVALISVGFDEVANSRPEIRRALGDGPVFAATGGHNADGSPLAELALDDIIAFVRSTSATIDAYAVVSQFSVRNPAHELEVAEALGAETDNPVTISHHLSPRLGGPQRAATTILNARLMALIEELLSAVRSALSGFGVEAPLMIVRGDGSMLSDSATSQAPIETILSGPAASIVGAAHLLGPTTAIVADIGGTTTDVAIMAEGKPRLAALGAKVGGQQTLVEAIEVTTIGLGGDSKISPISDGPNRGRLSVGPGRIVPVSMLAMTQSDLVYDTIERQGSGWGKGENFGRFVLATGHEPGRELSRPEQYVWDAMADGPVAADTALSSGTFRLGVAKLEAAGLARTSGFTPTDAAHVLGLHHEFDGEAARRVAELLLEVWTQRHFGPWSKVEALCGEAMDAVTRQSAELLLGVCLESDNLGDAETVTEPLAQAMLGQEVGLTRPTIALTLPIVGLGASASVYHQPIAAMLGTKVIVPPEAGVANALGAVVGQVRVKLTGTITQPTRGTYLTHGIPESGRFHDLDEARGQLSDRLTQMVVAKAELAGASLPHLTHTWDDKMIDVGGKPYLVEAKLTVESTSRPRLAS